MIRDRREAVHALLAGELPDAQANELRDALTTDSELRRELHDVMQLDVLVADARPGAAAGANGPVISLAWYRRPKALAAAAVPLVVAAAVTLLLLTRGPAQSPMQGLALAPKRSTEARFGYASASDYRPYSVARDHGAVEAIPLSSLAGLEARGDYHGLAVAHLLRGELDQAAAAFDRVGADTPLDADRAALAWTRGEYDRVLALTDASKGDAARWNRGLALRDLRLELSAAKAFVAAGHGQWAKEARRRSDALTEIAAANADTYGRVLAGGAELVATGAGLDVKDVSESPGLVRLYLYDAARAATSRKRAQALLPLAKALDAHHGGDAVSRYVRRVMASDFSKRGKLAATYARLVAQEPVDVVPWLLALRTGGYDDLLMGALLLSSSKSHVEAKHIDEYARLAGDDPWLKLLAAEQSAAIHLDAGRYAQAEGQLLTAFRSCKTTKQVYRCGRIAYRLAELYLTLHRVVEAKQFARWELDASRRINAQNQTSEALYLLATVAHLTDDTAGTGLAVARAYLDELTLRDPACQQAGSILELRAMARVNRLEYGVARRHLEAARNIAKTCQGYQIGFDGALAAAHVDRGGDTTTARGEIEALRASQSSSAWLAMLDYMEGRLLDSEPLLRRAITQEREVIARKARAYSYAVLVARAGRDGAWDRVLTLLAEELGRPAPTRCAVGIAIEEQHVVVVRDADGGTTGRMLATTLLTITSDSAVPQDLVHALSGCDKVAVLARPPVQGLPEILPSAMAWSYTTRRAESRTTPPATGPKRLVVADVEPPTELGLPQLAAFAGDTAGALVVRGAKATPSQVLAAMADATLIEMHAHGIVNLAESDASFVALSPEGDGTYALTARAIRGQPLTGRPVVLLGACRAALTTPYFHEAWSLPQAFLDAGATGVIASSEPILDRESAIAFERIRERLDRGETPAAAVAAERTGSLSKLVVLE